MSAATYFDLYSHQVSEIVPQLQPGQRRQVVVPAAACWDTRNDEYDWDLVEELQMFVRGTAPENMFIVLRFAEAQQELIVDMLRV